MGVTARRGFLCQRTDMLVPMGTILYPPLTGICITRSN
jgi:hypothetical protein